jgi:hypothetical protein
VNVGAGYSSITWDNGLDVAAIDTSWAALAPEEQQAAVLLGFSSHDIALGSDSLACWDPPVDIRVRPWKDLSAEETEALGRLGFATDEVWASRRMPDTVDKPWRALADEEKHAIGVLFKSGVGDSENMWNAPIAIDHGPGPPGAVNRVKRLGVFHGE